MVNLKVLGHDYEVVFGEQIADRSNIYGIHLPKTLKIFVDGTVPPTVTLETLWHEIHEAIAYWNSMDVDHNTLSCFAANSIALLLNNPWLTKLIYEYIATGKLDCVPEELDVEDYIAFQQYGRRQYEEEEQKHRCKGINGDREGMDKGMQESKGKE